MDQFWEEIIAIQKGKILCIFRTVCLMRRGDFSSVNRAPALAVYRSLSKKKETKDVTTTFKQKMLQVWLEFFKSIWTKNSVCLLPEKNQVTKLSEPLINEDWYGVGASMSGFTRGALLLLFCLFVCFLAKWSNSFSTPQPALLFYSNSRFSWGIRYLIRKKCH